VKYPQCDVNVPTYGIQGWHRCYRRAKSMVGNVRMCGFHAHTHAKREAKGESTS